MAETSGGDLPDGTSEIFFAQGLDMNSGDLPGRANHRRISRRFAAKTVAADAPSAPTDHVDNVCGSNASRHHC
jgi:hypothetical protein